MRHPIRASFLAIAVAAVAVGCAASHPPAPPSIVPAITVVGPATRPGDPRQWLTLSQIPNAPVLAPETQPATEPAPMAALLLYARAREAELDNQRMQATRLLEDACRIDPSSFQLQYSLARMYAAGQQEVAPDDTQTLEALENAARLEPDHLRLQIDLGREYLDKNNIASAVRHLRLALMTGEYREDDALAGVADFFLAGALQKQGYLRAALDEYRLLVDRLNNPTMAMRGSAELAVLLTHIDSFKAQIGELQEKLGEYPEALATFQPLLASEPGNIPLSARVVACLLGCNRPADAVALAARLVELHPGSPDAVKVLDEACEGANDLGDHAADESDQLARLSRAHPTNRALFYAWTESLEQHGNQRGALEALASASATDPYDPELLRRRFTIVWESGDPTLGGVENAARLLIDAVAQHPVLAEQVEPMWDQLLRPGRLPYLSFDELRGLAVPKDQEQAKEFFIAYAAQAFGRESIADPAYAQANSTGAYAPAARAQLEDIWSAGDLTDAQKAQRSEELAQHAQAAGNISLMHELRGLSLVHRKNLPDAAVEFLAAVGHSAGPQLLLESALATRDAGDPAAFEQAMWKLITSFPGFDPAYVSLINFYISHEQDEPAQNVVRDWLSADPANPIAQRIAALQALNTGRPDIAQTILSRLLETNDNDPDVLETAIAVQEQNGSLDPLVDRLSRHAIAEPANLALAGALAELYARMDRPADAERVLAAAAAKLADDPDMLYQLSGFYHHIGQSARSEQMLSDVLRLDRSYAGAANDLGYYWADASTHLPQAEALVRQAIAAEPHNAAFLDSLGWVLYKLGRFGEASGYLQTAATPRDTADPVVLNHLGDALYRLGHTQAAEQAWQAAAGKITASDDPELKTLRTSLLHKSQQLKANQPVDVAPARNSATQPASSALK
ncbi:MAG TPA: tetratricopeptide repeat protein [Tepidisphaeraceae bacterium]|jgi:predicted Zn-dependent protease|nr:tetratricopeptide repeat protein [Tepidisphaeraceae bacterium]